jgi:hypothetical protein
MIYGGCPEGTDTPAPNQATHATRCSHTHPYPLDRSLPSPTVLACSLHSTVAPACWLGNAARRAPPHCRALPPALPSFLPLRELYVTSRCPATQRPCPHRRRGRRRLLRRGRWSFTGSEPSSSSSFGSKPSTSSSSGSEGHSGG